MGLSPPLLILWKRRRSLNVPFGRWFFLRQQQCQQQRTDEEEEEEGLSRLRALSVARAKEDLSRGEKEREKKISFFSSSPSRRVSPLCPACDNRAIEFCATLTAPCAVVVLFYVTYSFFPLSPDIARNRVGVLLFKQCFAQYLCNDGVSKLHFAVHSPFVSLGSFLMAAFLGNRA